MWEDDWVADEGFYEEDEPIEDLRAAWDAGEPGVTSGSRGLSPRAMSIVARAVADFNGPRRVSLRVVKSGTNATTDFPESDAPVSAMDQVRDETVTALAYQVG